MTDVFDPLATSRRIAGDYVRYLRTTFSPDDPALRADFDRELGNGESLSRGPVLQASAPYRTAGSIADLIREGILSSELTQLGTAGLGIDRPLYTHQEQAIRKVASGRNVVVATGTGSGKTESFLLPVLDSLLRERDAGTLNQPGVRALLLYPMNALANDQLGRLRELLTVFPDITFGRYVGDTEYTRGKGVSTHRKRFGGDPLPNELVSRDAMQEAPPHILLTNYAMLEYLLLRPFEAPFFDNETGDHWKFLVLDEIHVYDGAKGAEMGMLLRRVRDRVVDSRRGALTCIGTSATLGKGEDSTPRLLSFAEQIFDESFEFVADDVSRQDIVTADREELVHTSATWFLPEDLLVELRDRFRAGESAATIADWLGPVGQMPPPEGAEMAGEWLGRVLASETHVVDLQQRLRDGSVELDRIAGEIMAGAEPDAKVAALVDVCVGSHVPGTNRPLLPARWHFLLRALEGAFACFSEHHPFGHPRLRLSRHSTCPACREADRPSAMFEVGVCRRCGIPHLVGRKREEDGLTKFGPMPITEQLPAHLVFLSAIEQGGDEDEDESIEGEEAGASIHDRLRLCLQCGAIGTRADPACGCGAEIVDVVDVKPRNPEQPLRKCVVCTARTSGAGIVRRFLTGADAPVAVVATSLYQQLPPAAPPATTDEWSAPIRVGDGRKLLSFADSRQDAAFFAPYLERTYNRAVQRRLLWQAISGRSELGGVRPRDLYVPLANLARGHQIVDEKRRSISDQSRDWIHAEILAADRQQSLEGVGLVEVSVALPDGLRVPPPLMRMLDLDEGDTLDLVRILLGTLITRRSVTADDLVDYEDPIFSGYPLTSVRLMGSANKIISWLPSRPGATNQRVTYLQRVLTEIGNDREPAEILETLWTKWFTGPESPWRNVLTSTTDSRSGTVYRLAADSIEFTPVGPDHRSMRCERCRQVWWRTIRGICPGVRCDGRVRLVDAVNTNPNHYRQLYESMSLIGQRVEEHTAQLTSDEAANRQQDFIDGRINVLSCSTTFELGVDVGEVVAVLMRNVPPSPANYVQRAGRAGRRAGSPALVVTFAQRRSHDLHFFDEPFGMIDGEVSPPIVEIENPHIVRRHLNAMAFAAYERMTLSDDFPAGHKTVRDFILPETTAPAERMIAWLRSHPIEIGDAALRVCPPALVGHPDIDLSTWRWLDGLDGSPDEPGMGRLRTAAAKIRREVDELEETERDLAEQQKYGPAGAVKRVVDTLLRQNTVQFLAQRSVLPKYGFPVDVVSLRLTENSTVELSRDLSMAIVDFAPGAEVVADKRIWRSVGIEKPPGMEFIIRRWRVCGRCGSLRTWLADQADRDECEVCGSGELHRAGTYMHPIFGFVGEMVSRSPGDQRPIRQGYLQHFFTDFAGEAPEVQRIDLGTQHVDALYSRQGQITVLNEGKRSAGYAVCTWCGAAGVADSGTPSNPHTPPGRPKAVCSGSPRRVTLGHNYLTDAVEVRLGGSFTRDETLSALHAVLGVVDVVGIEASDVNGVVHASHEGRNTMVIFDTVPGGAGHARRISESIPELFSAALGKVQHCDCGEETSCYGCLRSYRNQIDHERLTRALAISVLSALL